MYVADVSAKTAEGHTRNVKELENSFNLQANKANKFFFLALETQGSTSM